VRFSEFGANLKLEEIVAGAALFSESACDYVIGIGGGSVLDLAKAVSLIGVQPDDPARYVTEQLAPTQDRVGTTMIPTTAGTGSESTHFSVIYVDGHKQSLSHQSMLPDTALVDPDLTDSLPPDVTACSGLDALCQAIESFWSNRSTSDSRKLSARAIRIIMANLERAVNAPTPEAREQMLIAANLSGQAINVARTTAAHAASYPLTSRFGITHGHAVGLILPHLFGLNAAVTEASLQDERGLTFVHTIFAELLDSIGVGSAGEAKTELMDLMQRVHLSPRLSDFGVSRDQLEQVADGPINSARATNNPRRIGRDELALLYRSIY
jgi:alcohol dehydrogenase class IV